MNALDIVRAGFTVGRRRNSYSTNNRNLNLGIILSRSQALPVSKKTTYLRGEDYAIYTPDFYSKICKGTKFIRIIPLSPKEAILLNFSTRSSGQGLIAQSTFTHVYI